MFELALLLTCRTPGPQLKDWHVVGHDFDKDAKFKFPKKWCLGPLVENDAINDTECQTPAGIAAISYDINPLVSCTNSLSNNCFRF